MKNVKTLLRTQRPLLSLLALPLLFSSNAFAELTKVVSLPSSTPPGNIAVGPKGRIFMSVHEFYGPKQKVVEVLKNGKTKPYPDASWSVSEKLGKHGLNGVLGLNVDKNGILWLLDGATPTSNARLVAWDTQKEALHRVIYLGFPITHAKSFVNDLAIDTTHNAIYITDVATPDTSALIVVDLNTGQARRVLSGSQYTAPENIDMVIDGKTVTLGANPARIGVNPITIDNQHQWVYFAPMTGTSLYRIKTQDLRNPELSDDELAKKVQRYGDKPISDGITIDSKGNVYITAITQNSIGVTRPNGQYETLYQNDKISWPDGFAVGPNNSVYFTVNELHLSPVLNNGKNDSTGQFAIYRFKAEAPAQVGR